MLSDYDVACLEELSTEGIEVDWVSISYTHDAADLRDVRAVMDQLPGLRSAAMLAKVETRGALMSIRVSAHAYDPWVLSGDLGHPCFVL